MAEGARHFLDSFNDPEAVARYMVAGMLPAARRNTIGHST